MVRNVKIGARLLIMSGLFSALLAVVSAITLNGIQSANDSLGTVYKDRLIPIKQIETILDLYAVHVGRALSRVVDGETSLSEGQREVQTAIRNVSEEWSTYMTTSLTPEEKILAAEVETLIKRTNESAESVLAAMKTDSRAKAGVDRQIYSHIDPLLDKLQSLSDLQAKVADQEYEGAKAGYVSIRNASILAIAFGVALALVVGFVITRSITVPLKRAVGVAEQIAAGDLTVNLQSEAGRDEVNALVESFRQMVDKLRSQTRDIAEATNVLASSSTEIVASVSQIAASASETAAAVNETATTVEEVRQTAQVSNQKAKHVSESAQKAVSVSEAGEKSVDQAISGMDRIQEQMDSIASSIVRLSEQSQAIGEIIASVNDLAEQSNLLAVNASIEAARAGEQGKGFAVVAQEVKTLAEQSKQATGQVRTILSDIQKATGAAVMAIEQGSKAVEAGARQSTSTGESIQALAKSVGDAAQAAVQIAASSQQQLIGVDQVMLAMENIKQASAQNVDSMKQVESAAHNLHELGQRLKFLVGYYRV